MSTALIVVLVVVVVALVAVALVRMNRGKSGGGSLRGRFGPEYERAVAQHNGDTKAAEQELAERVKRHGSLRERTLAPEERERYLARWAALQERFVDAPREAVAGADELVTEVAGARGFPAEAGHSDRVEALSVHHPHHVDGYRKLHDMVTVGHGAPGAEGGAPGAEGVPGHSAGAPGSTGLPGSAGAPVAAGTEALREAMVQARALFDELVGAPEHGRHSRDSRGGKGGRLGGTGAHDPAQDPNRDPAAYPAQDPQREYGAGHSAAAPGPATGIDPVSTRDVKGS